MTADVSPSRPDLEGLERSVQPIEVVVMELRNLLGARLVAYIGSVGETRVVDQWADGERAVGSEDKAIRLRAALHVAVLLGEHDTPEVIQAWFQGLNPQLADRSPARFLREGDIAEVGPMVLTAARAFASEG